MTDYVGVVEDGVATEVSRKRGNSGWLLAATGFVLGLGLGLIVMTSVPDSGVAQTTQVSDQGESVAGAVGIAETVPSFPDTLVAVGWPTGSALNHLLWPHSGELRVEAMAGGQDVVLDASGRLVALSEPVPGSAGVLLSMGPFIQITAVSSDVTSYVWHDREAGILSYTTESEDEWRLWEVGPDLSPELVTESGGSQGTLVAFGDWGWALQTGGATLTLLTPDGELKDVEPGVGYASHPDGWIFAVDDGPKLVSAGGGVKRVMADLGVGAVTVAALSPDRTHVAVGGPSGWTVVDVASGVVDRPFSVSTMSLAWSSDSRFAISGGGSGVTIYDVDRTTPYSVLSGRRVMAVGVAPRGRP